MTKPKPQVPETISEEEKAALVKWQEHKTAYQERPAIGFTASEGDYKVQFDGSKGGGLTRMALMNTTGCHTLDSGVTLLSQVLNATKSESVDTCNAVAEWMNGIRPQSPLEGMVAAQMVTAHTLAMNFAQRAIKGDHIDHIDANVKRVAKLMGAFAKHMETLQKYRSNGQQTIQVQHVQVNEGGQAIVGNVNQTPSGQG